MIAAPTYSIILDKVQQTLDYLSASVITLDSAHPSTDNIMMEINKRTRNDTFVGVLFCNPNTPYVKAEVLPSLKYFHIRSGSNFDFYCCGFGTSWPENEYPDKQEVTKIDGVDWLYSEKAFVGLIEDFERETKWRFSGETELLLLDIERTEGTKNGISISSGLVFNLEKMQKDGALSSVRAFFETIMTFTRTCDYQGVSAFSDISGIKIAGSTLKSAILALLPKEVAGAYSKAENFAVKEL